MKTHATNSANAHLAPVTVEQFPGPIGDELDPFASAWHEFYDRWELSHNLLDPSMGRDFRATARSNGTPIAPGGLRSGSIVASLVGKPSVLAMDGSPVRDGEVVITALNRAAVRVDHWIRCGRLIDPPPRTHASGPRLRDPPLRLPRHIDLACGSVKDGESIIPKLLALGCGVRQLGVFQGVTKGLRYAMTANAINRMVGD